MWFREYIFNILLQPFHYLLYTVLVGAAINLVSSSMIYAVIAIGFMIPAEKLLRKFFGFDNAGTLSAAGSFAGGAVFSAMINRLNRPKPGKGGPGGGSDKATQRPIRKANSGGGGVDPEATLTGSSGSPTPTPGGGPVPTPGGGGGPVPTPGGGSGPIPTPGGVNPSSSNFLDRSSHRIRVWDRLSAGGARDAARALGYRYKEKAINGAKSLPGTFRRAAIGGLTGGALGLIGAGYGIATGDPSKAFQYAAAAGAAGYYGSNYYGDKLAKEGKEASKTASAAFWGDQAKLRQQYLFDKEFKESSENIDTLTKTLGSRDQAKEAMKDGSVQALLNNGITDPSKVAKALKLRNKYKSKGMSDDAALQRAVAMAKWNRDSGKGIYEINSRARDSFIKQTMEQIRESDPDNYNEAEAKSRVQQILDDMESFEL